MKRSSRPMKMSGCTTKEENGQTEPVYQVHREVDSDHEEDVVRTQLAAVVAAFMHLVRQEQADGAHQKRADGHHNVDMRVENELEHEVTQTRDAQVIRASDAFRSEE